MLSRYEETFEVAKMSDVGYNVISIWGRELRKLLHENPGLEMNLILTPF